MTTVALAAANAARSNVAPRVVVTGIGAVTPLGIGAETFWEGLTAGRSGIREIQHFDAGNLPVPEMSDDADASDDGARTREGDPDFGSRGATR